MYGAPSCLLPDFIPPLPHAFPFTEIVAIFPTVSPKDPPRHAPICDPVISNREKNVVKKFVFPTSIEFVKYTPVMYCIFDTLSILFCL